jgi:spore germination cell wall hydrolase CwlJ-like protein
MEIVTEFVPETPTVADNDRQMLAEIVWHEAGSSWISQYNKAKVAAGVMNRVNDSKFPNTVYGVLTQPYQFSGSQQGESRC